MIDMQALQIIIAMLHIGRDHEHIAHFDLKAVLSDIMAAAAVHHNIQLPKIMRMHAYMVVYMHKGLNQVLPFGLKRIRIIPMIFSFFFFQKFRQHFHHSHF